MEDITIDKFIERAVTNGVGYASDKSKNNTEWGLQTRLCQLECDTAESPIVKEEYNGIIQRMKSIESEHKRYGHIRISYQEESKKLPDTVQRIDEILNYRSDLAEDFEFIQPDSCMPTY